MFADGENLARSVVKSFSESRSENVSKVGRPPSVEADRDSNGLLKCDSCLIRLRSPPRINLCSSSSPEHRVGKVGKSTAVAMLFVFRVSTNRFRGSQKSKSVSDMTECGTGEGEGERDGQELMERRSEAWLPISEGGWINTTDTTN